MHGQSTNDLGIPSTLDSSEIVSKHLKLSDFFPARNKISVCGFWGGFCFFLVLVFFNSLRLEPIQPQIGKLHNIKREPSYQHPK